MHALKQFNYALTLAKHKLYANSTKSCPGPTITSALPMLGSELRILANEWRRPLFGLKPNN